MRSGIAVASGRFGVADTERCGPCLTSGVTDALVVGGTPQVRDGRWAGGGWEFLNPMSTIPGREGSLPLCPAGTNASGRSTRPRAKMPA